MNHRALWPACSWPHCSRRPRPRPTGATCSGPSTARTTPSISSARCVLRPQDGALPSVADAAYADAEQLIMEIDMDEALADPASVVQAMQAEAMLPEGQSLREVLAADYARVAERARLAGFELELLDRFAPWFVAVTLMQLELENHGFSAELGVEQTLTRRAVADRKPIAGLETVAQQFRHVRPHAAAGAEALAADDARGDRGTRGRGRQAARSLRSGDIESLEDPVRGIRDSRNSTACSPRTATAPGCRSS